MKTTTLVRCLVLLAIVASAAACTPYQRNGFMGGYTDLKVRPGMYAITVQGNAYTAKSTLVEYWHRRARELCNGDYMPQTSVSSTTSYSGGFSTDVMSFTRGDVEGYAVCDPHDPTDGGTAAPAIATPPATTSAPDLAVKLEGLPRGTPATHTQPSPYRANKRTVARLER